MTAVLHSGAAVDDGGHVLRVLCGVWCVSGVMLLQCSLYAHTIGVEPAPSHATSEHHVKQVLWTELLLVIAPCVLGRRARFLVCGNQTVNSCSVRRTVHNSTQLERQQLKTHRAKLVVVGALVCICESCDSL